MGLADILYDEVFARGNVPVGRTSPWYHPIICQLACIYNLFLRRRDSKVPEWKSESWMIVLGPFLNISLDKRLSNFAFKFRFPCGQPFRVTSPRERPVPPRVKPLRWIKGGWKWNMFRGLRVQFWRFWAGFNARVLQTLRLKAFWVYWLIESWIFIPSPHEKQKYIFQLSR